MKDDKFSSELFERFFGIKLETDNDELRNLFNLIQFILYERYLPQKPPVLSKIPFVHPHIIPSRIRNKVSRLIKGNLNKNVDRGFPNFPFDFSVDFLKMYLKDKFCPEKEIIPFWP